MAYTSARSGSASPLRQRLPPARAATFADLPPRRAASPADAGSRPRGASFMTTASNASSLRDSTDDLLLPGPSGAVGTAGHIEPSHWHSAPLALALLPAVGGLLFQNGSSVITDLTLLALAAIFLNWSVRLPWYVHPA